MWSLLAIYMLVSSSYAAAQFYDSRYDNFDIGPLIDNDRILSSYTKCFLDKGPCTAEGKDFKKTIPEALESSCSKCTPKQKELIKKVIKAVMDKHPDVWKELNSKYDPEDKYREDFEKFLKE